MSAGATPRHGASAATWVLVAAACLARFVHLDADPKFEFWIGYIVDEGRWVETARNLALFGEPRLYTLSQLHLTLNPGGQAVSLLLFELFGVSLWSARLWTAACSAGIVVLTAWSMGRVAPGLPQLLAVAVVGFEPLTLGLGRTTLPEAPAAFFMLCAFLVVNMQGRRVLGAATGGVLVAVAMAMKLTVVLAAPAFVLMILLAGTSESMRERVVRVAAFGLGAGLPGLAGLAAAVSGGLVRPGSIADVTRPLLNALDLGSPYVVLARFFVPPEPWANVSRLLLGAWVGSWVLAFWRQFRGTPLGELYVSSGLWVVVWFVMVGSLDYTPWRYAIHVVVPLAIHVATGLALWRRIGPERVIAQAAAARGPWGLAATVWLCLPAGLLVGMAVIEWGLEAGWPVGALSRRLIVAALAVGVSVLVVRATKPVDRGFRALITFAVAAAAAQAMLDELVAYASPHATPVWAMPVGGLLVLSACAAWAAFDGGRGGGMREWPRRGALACAIVVAVAVAQGAPVVLFPTYSMREASRDLARRFEGTHLLRSVGAGSLLVDTAIPYRDEEHRGDVFDGMIVLFADVRIPAHFVRESAYVISPHPRFASPGRHVTESGGIRVDAYRNRIADGSQPGTPAAESPSSPPARH